MTAKSAFVAVPMTNGKKAFIPAFGTYWVNLMTGRFSTDPFDSMTSSATSLQNKSNKRPYVEVQPVFKNQDVHNDDSDESNENDKSQFNYRAEVIDLIIDTPTDDYETSAKEEAIGKATTEYAVEQEVETGVRQIRNEVTARQAPRPAATRLPMDQQSMSHH